MVVSERECAEVKILGVVARCVFARSQFVEARRGDSM